MRTARWETVAQMVERTEVPPRQRSRIPILSDERSPVWVYGLGVDKKGFADRGNNAFFGD